MLDHMVFQQLQVCFIEDAVAQWCNPLTLKPEQSGRVGSIPGRTPPLERHDICSISAIPALGGAKKCNCTFTFYLSKINSFVERNNNTELTEKEA